MIKYLILLLIFFMKIAFVKAEVVQSISVNGNDRITDETIIIFSKVNIGDDLIMNDLNNIIENLYSSDFFKNVSIILTVKQSIAWEEKIYPANAGK